MEFATEHFQSVGPEAIPFGEFGGWLWLLCLTFPVDNHKLEEFANACEPARRRRAQQYRQHEDRVRCLAAGWLARRAVSGATVSISHSGSWVACAAADRAVGVDVEEVCPEINNVAEFFMSGMELEIYRALPAIKQRHYGVTLWTAKEAYLKALGTGFRTDPASVTIADLTGWRFDHRSLGSNYHLTVCWKEG